MGKLSEQHGRRAVRARSAGFCELRIEGVCQGRATNVSHRCPKGQGGEWSPANLLDACGSGTTGCHGYVEQHREWAYERGYLLRSGVDAATVPIRTSHPVYGPALWQLTDDGLMEWLGTY